MYVRRPLKYQIIEIWRSSTMLRSFGESICEIPAKEFEKHLGKLCERICETIAKSLRNFLRNLGKTLKKRFPKRFTAFD